MAPNLSATRSTSSEQVLSRILSPRTTNTPSSALKLQSGLESTRRPENIVTAMC